VIVNLLLIGLFGLQHSVMARPAFKRWWTRIVPVPMDRSSFVLAASLALASLMWQWRPIAEPVIWRIESIAGAVLIGLVFWTACCCWPPSWSTTSSFSGCARCSRGCSAPPCR